VESGRPRGQVLLRYIRRYLLTYTLGAPHLLEKDDVYNGYFIPAETIVLPNQWCVYNHSFLCVLIIWMVLNV